MPRWYSSSYQSIYDALVKLVPRFPPNLHLLPIYATDFTMFEQGSSVFYLVFLIFWFFCKICLCRF